MDKADADSEQCKQEAAEDWIADDIQVKLEPCHDEHCLDEERLMIDPIVCQQGLDLFCADVPIKCMEEIEIDEVKVQPFYEGDEIMKSIPGENDKLQVILESTLNVTWVQL
ncbi:hypothetical protein ZHAS_00019279 [Anopheles sinensis]|uniref:Uncharacterized protein n=1 Tax=Anopheles sinensis TaxID=74873 RepID=A0A084WLZ3_ANOSI|nr:hypothetical protein ZHAS_00019279 [Anopheles sinensis]